MSFVPCYFCPAGRKRTDKLRDHCRRLHPNGTGVVTSAKNALGYVFHFLDGHTDRVWATCRGGESPTSVGHCFLCHTFIEREGYKTIELAVAAHVCNPELGKERAKRSGTHLSAHLPATGGAGTTARANGMWVTEDTLMEMWKESVTGVPGQRALDLVLNARDEVDVRLTLDKLMEDVVAKTKTDNLNKRLQREVDELKAGGGTVSSEMDWSQVLMLAKSRYSPIRQWYASLLAQSEAANEDDSPLGERFLLAVFEMLGDTQRQLAESKKEADRLEAERVLTSTEHMKALQRNIILERDAQAYERELNTMASSLERALKQVADAAPTAPVSVPPGDEAPLSGCKSE